MFSLAPAPNIGLPNFPELLEFWLGVSDMYPLVLIKEEFVSELLGIEVFGSEVVDTSDFVESCKTFTLLW